MVQDMVGRAAAGDSAAADRVLQAFGQLAPDERSGVLDELAALAAGGSARALELLLRLVDDHHLDRPALRRVLVDNDEVDDAHQDVLIAVARSIERFEGRSAFTTWLHSIARNTAFGHVRRRRSTDRLDTDRPPAGPARRLSSLIADRADLREAIDDLPAHYRSALVLRDIEQRSYRDIAAALDIEINTVKSRLSRARALLASAPQLRPLTELDPDPEPDGDGDGDGDGRHRG